MIYFVTGILILLVVVSRVRGYGFREIFEMAWPGIRGALIVAEVLVLIGCLTGLWRGNGTIAYFIDRGIRLLPPSLFVLSAFLLAAAMSLAIGTSFGVVATAGVILMSIARAGGVHPIPVAGAIMSGIYVGDRNSPAASSAALVAAVTGTDQNRNIRIMFRSALPVLILCTILYAALSFVFPMKEMNTDAVSLLSSSFQMSWICMVPAALMLVLPLCKVKVKTAMAVDILVSFLIAVFIQHAGVGETFKVMVMGYEASDEELSVLLNGGGIRSMLEVCYILVVSGSFADIMNGTGLLTGAYRLVEKSRDKIGRTGTMTLLSVLTCAILCNQTIGVLMVNRLGSNLYRESEKYEKMLDIENSVIMIAGLVPWCIAASVPLNTMGVGAQALPLSFFVWLLPLWHLGKSFVMKRKRERSV